MLSGRGGNTNNRGTPSCFTEGESLGDKEVLEVNNLGVTPKGVLLVEAVLSDEEFIGETGDTPGRLTVGKDTRLQLSGHNIEVKEHNDLNHPVGWKAVQLSVRKYVRPSCPRIK